MKKTLESGYIQHVRKNAEAKKPWAQKAMGDVFYYGIDMQEDLNNMDDEEKIKKVQENQKNAFEYYCKAAEQSEPSAMHAVGGAYYFGEGAELDHKKAAEWYHKAADAGDAESLYFLAQMYQYGMGVEQDIPKAVDLYRKALKDHSHARSLYPLAQTYLKNQKILEVTDENILSLLIFASRNGNIAAGHDLDSIDFNLLKVSPAQLKQILDNDLNDAHIKFQDTWNRVMQNMLSGISAKIAIAEPSSESLSAKEVFNRVWRSVVYIEASNGNSGSGVIVQPDIVATNHHVVRGADKVFVHQPKEQSGRESISYPAHQHPVPATYGRDYCLLHVPLLPGLGVPATIRRYETLKIGETVYALGAPKREKLSLSKGLISQLRDGTLIQSDVHIADGSSGGGLFDSVGNLIGHPTFSFLDQNTGLKEKGMEYSIPADIVLEFGKESKTE